MAHEIGATTDPPSEALSVEGKLQRCTLCYRDRIGQAIARSTASLSARAQDQLNSVARGLDDQLFRLEIWTSDIGKEDGVFEDLLAYNSSDNILHEHLKSILDDLEARLQGFGETLESMDTLTRASIQKMSKRSLAQWTSSFDQACSRAQKQNAALADLISLLIDLTESIQMERAALFQKGPFSGLRQQIALTRVEATPVTDTLETTLDLWRGKKANQLEPEVVPGRFNIPQLADATEQGIVPGKFNIPQPVNETEPSKIVSGKSFTAKDASKGTPRTSVEDLSSKQPASEVLLGKEKQEVTVERGTADEPPIQEVTQTPGSPSSDRPQLFALPPPAPSLPRLFRPPYSAGVTSTGPCLLSLDGGGIRSFSSLLILKHLMRVIHRSTLDGSADPNSSQIASDWTTAQQRPCTYFDIIAGTGTGGLIAIMLGRLGMGIDSCIAQFERLALEVFQKPRAMSFRSSVVQRAKYSHHRFETAINEVMAEYNVRFRADAVDGCKTLVMACRVDAERLVNHPFRTYQIKNSDRKRGPSTVVDDASIGEVARATTATPYYFDSVKIRGTRLVSGDLAGFNPTLLAIREAATMSKHPAGLVVSIGAGVNIKDEAALNKIRQHYSQSGVDRKVNSTLKILPGYLKGLNKTEKELFNSEQVHKIAQAKYSSQPGSSYLRLSVQSGLEDIVSYDLKRVGSSSSQDTMLRIRKATTKYLRQPDVQRSLEGLAEKLIAHKLATKSRSDLSQESKMKAGPTQVVEPVSTSSERERSLILQSSVPEMSEGKPDPGNLQEAPPGLIPQPVIPVIHSPVGPSPLGPSSTDRPTVLSSTSVSASSKANSTTSLPQSRGKIPQSLRNSPFRVERNAEYLRPRDIELSEVRRLQGRERQERLAEIATTRARLDDETAERRRPIVISERSPRLPISLTHLNPTTSSIMRNRLRRKRDSRKDSTPSASEDLVPAIRIDRTTYRR